MITPASQTAQSQMTKADNPQQELFSSSPGDCSPSVTPKDVSPHEAAARDVTERKTASDDIDEREEALLDDAIDLSFPASDPIAIPSYDVAQKEWKGGKMQAP